MLTYTGWRNRYGEFTNNTSTKNLNNGSSWMNEIYLRLMGARDWSFLQKETTIDTVAGQQFYDLREDFDKAVAISLDIGTTKYTMQPIVSRVEWEQVNYNTSWSSTYPIAYIIKNGQVGIYPTPATAGNTINVIYRKTVKSLSIEDYTTGTVSAIANDAVAVTGNGTAWTAKMAGAHIKIDDSFNANTGDGRWYEIASSGGSTALTLTRPYQGTTITGGSATYTIGQVSEIPEKYQDIVPKYAAYMYWLIDTDIPRADRFKNEYNEMLEQMIADEGSTTTDVLIEPVLEDRFANPNLFIVA